MMWFVPNPLWSKNLDVWTLQENILRGRQEAQLDLEDSLSNALDAFGGNLGELSASICNDENSNIWILLLI